MNQSYRARMSFSSAYRWVGVVILVLLGLVLMSGSTRAKEPDRGTDQFVYLPIIVQPPIATTGNVTVTTIFYNGSGSSEPDEYVQIRNDDSQVIQLAGWTLRDEANHVFTFPNFELDPGQVCRIYTNQHHPEWCGFNYGNSAAIWNNGGDCGTLQNSTGAIIDTYCYP